MLCPTVFFCVRAAEGRLEVVAMGGETGLRGLSPLVRKSRKAAGGRFGHVQPATGVAGQQD